MKIKGLLYFKFFSNRKDCTCHDYDALKGFNKQLEESLKKYSELYVDSQRALVQKDKKIAELESKLAEVTKDKEYLLKKFEEVKNVFSN